MLKLSSLFPIHCTDRAVSHVFYTLCTKFCGTDLQVRMVVPSCDPSCRGTNLVEAVPQFLKPLYYRSANAPRIMAEKRFLQDIKNFDAAYLWMATSGETFRKVKQSNVPIFLERINCHQGKAKRILDQAYQRLGIEPQHTITPETISEEDAELELADFIFCPSQEVKKSFQEAGVPESKLIQTSEGWSPKRFPNTSTKKEVSDSVTVLFLGKISVRKGAHLLLRAWERAGIKGRLLMFGEIEPAIAQTCGDFFKRPDIVHHAHSNNYAFAYREADIFALPSLEEGSPLVAYEAMAHGLPMLVSPMGAGGIVRDSLDGIVLDPYDQDAWVESLRKLAASKDLRARFGNSGRQWIQEFTWEKVAQRRKASLLEKLNVQKLCVS
ncbi:MAG: glycosyltransferase family 4 protein [Potamolinea sp.]